MGVKESLDCPCCYAARVAGMVKAMAALQAGEGRARGPVELALRLAYCETALQLMSAPGLPVWQLCEVHRGSAWCGENACVDGCRHG